MFDQRLYESNRRLLASINPSLAEKLGSLEVSKSPLSPIPQQEIEDWYKDLKLDGIAVLYVYGLGSGEGYEVVKPWLKENPSHYVIFLEDDLQTLHQFLGSPQAKHLLNDLQVEIRDISKATVERSVIRELTQDNMLRPQAITALPHYQREKFSEFTMIRDLILIETSEQNGTSIEWANYGIAFYKNFYSNLLELPHAYEGQRLFNQFKNVPAIICAGGPSLKKQIPLLKKLCDKALIIAPSTALNVLTSEGIWPHFGVVLDPTPSSFQQQYLQRGFEIPIFYQNRVYHETLTSIHGPKLYLPYGNFYLIEDWFEEQMNLESLQLERGYSSVNTALSIAKALGCNPIIFVGLELSKSSEDPSASNVEKHPLYPFGAEGKPDLGSPIQVKDINGNEVTSYWPWITEAQWIDNYYRQNPSLTLINATEAGIGQFSVPNLTLQETADKYLTKTYDLDLLVHHTIQQAGFLPITVSQVRDHLEIFFQSIKRCLELCRQIDKSITEDPENQIKLEKNLKKEVGYQYLLIQLENFFLTFTKKEQRNISRLSNAKEKTNKKQHLDHLLYRYLIQALEIHLQMIALSLSQNQMSEEISSHAKVEISEEDESQKVFRYASGAISSIQTYANNLREGIHRYYYPHGTLKSEIHYKKGLLHGTTKLYYSNGKIRRELFFQENLREGKEISWYENGQKFTEIDYHKNTATHAQCWYHNGTLGKDITL